MSDSKQCAKQSGIGTSVTSLSMKPSGVKGMSPSTSNPSGSSQSANRGKQG